MNGTNQHDLRCRPCEASRGEIRLPLGDPAVGARGTSSGGPIPPTPFATGARMKQEVGSVHLTISRNALIRIRSIAQTEPPHIAVTKINQIANAAINTFSR